MLYKKKNTQVLDNELFKNPTSEYRGAPFWGWNCTLQEDELLRQIDIFKEMGFGGFHMHPRSGMKTKYLGEEYMKMVKACLKKAKDENMLCWLYDEDRWASGSAGGYVTSIKKYRERIMFFTVNALCDATDKETAVENGLPYLLNVFDVVLNSDGTLKSYKEIDEKADAEGQKWYVYSKNPRELGWYNGNTFVDTLNPQAIDKFLEVTHEAYYREVGEEFGKAIPAIFTDEPHHSDMDQIRFSADTNDFSLTWTPDFDETFEAEYGFDIKKKLPELVWNLENNEVSRVRYCYHNHISHRFTNSFIKKMGAWCKEHNIHLTGHMSEEDSLIMQTRLVGEQMRAYPHFGIPGVDMLCDTICPTTTKQVQSVVHQYEKEGMIAEHCGVTNWDFDFKGHKFHTDWLMAMGVTARVHHGSWVSAKGMAKRDFPASINYHSPWYKEYSYVEDHAARISTVLTRGKAIVKVAVIHPIESTWLYFGAQENNAEKQRELEDNFQNVTKWLLRGNIDFDFVSEELLCDNYKGSSNGKFGVGAMEYEAVIVPECVTMRSSTINKLKEFKNAGGKLIFMGKCPEYVDAEKSDGIKELFEKSQNISFNRNNLLEALKEQRDVEIRDNSGAFTENLIHALRQDGEYKWLFLAHIVKDENLEGHITVGVQTAKPQNIRIKIKGEYRSVLFDTINGEIREIPYKTENGQTYIEYGLYSHESLLLRLEKTDIKELKEEKTEEKLIKTETIKQKLSYKREEENVYLLDMPSFSEDGKNYSEPEEIRRIDTRLNEKYGFPTLDLDDMQPWAREAKEERKIFLKFTVYSEIDVDNAFLACEEIYEAALNGESFSLCDYGWYFDKSIRKYPMPKIKKGENILLVKVPFSNLISLENMYILGDFGVRTEGTRALIIPETREICFGDIVNQGMPFYGGNITYTYEVHTPEAAIKIQLPKYAGALVKVTVDEKYEGIIAYSPYIFKTEKLNAGKHKIEFKLYGNRYNTFGALHNCGNMRWAGPGMWFAKDCDWCYEYNLRKMGILASPIISYVD